MTSKSGDKLERIGGHTHYGMTDRYDRAASIRALPLGIAKDAVITRPVAKGATITYDDVTLPDGLTVITLRKLQDAWMQGQMDEQHLMEQVRALATQV